MKMNLFRSCQRSANALFPPTLSFTLIRGKTPRTLALVVAAGLAGSALAQTSPGGLLEAAGASVRAPLSKLQLDNLVPPSGSFTFPAPYNTVAIRLTNENDCNGNDCVNHAGYSYWPNINNHVGQDSMLIFVGLDRNQGGAGPTLLQYNKLDNKVDNLGPLFDSASPFSWATGEGWYFSATDPTALYINDQQSLFRYDVIQETYETVFNATRFGSGRYLWQFHSSADDRVHSATLRANNDYSMLGCVVYFEDSGQQRYFPRKGEFDECQVDKSGDWLLIKENIDGLDGEDNRIINLVTGQERILLDRNGAAGHSDLGYGYMVAADNWASAANTHKLWDFNAAVLQGKVVYQNNDWQVSAPDHLSHSNAAPGKTPEQQYACGSSVNQHNSAHANEIICFGLNGDGRTLVVAPVMTTLDGSDPYVLAPKGNLDPTGRYFIWTSNLGGPRLDFFLVKVPGHLLDGGAATEPPPVPNPPPVPVGDVTAPVPSAVAATALGADSARINWKSNEPAASMVQYGKTTAYGSSTPINNSLTTTHATTLTGLSAATLYHYRLMMRDAAGNVSTSGDYTFSTAPAALPPPAPLGWATATNISVGADGSLRKTGGCNGCADANAVSREALASGNMALEVTVSDVSKEYYLGISTSQANTKPNQMDFAFSIQGGYVEVRENGAYRKDSSLKNGDVLKISLVGGKVSYARNGTVFHTSTSAAVYPLRAYATLLGTGSKTGPVLFKLLP